MNYEQRTINYLRTMNNELRTTDNWQLYSTVVEDSLQINLFMQNKANFRKSQMNVNKVLTNAYEEKTLGEHGKKQSQTKPNKAKFKKAKMNVTSIVTKGYENKPPIRTPKKQSQISKRQKPMQTFLPKRIMKKPPLRAPKKQTQYKPNQSQFQTSFTLCESFLFFTFLCPGYNSVKWAGQEQTASVSKGPVEHFSSIEVQYRYEC